MSLIILFLASSRVILYCSLKRKLEGLTRLVLDKTMILVNFISHDLHLSVLHLLLPEFSRYIVNEASRTFS